MEGMGMGDVKMLGMIGAFLGAPLMALTLVLASFAGALDDLKKGVKVAASGGGAGCEVRSPSPGASPRRCTT